MKSEHVQDCQVQSKQSMKVVIFKYSEKVGLLSPQLGEIFDTVTQGPETKQVICNGSFTEWVAGLALLFSPTPECSTPGEWNSRKVLLPYKGLQGVSTVGIRPNLLPAAVTTMKMR